MKNDCVLLGGFFIAAGTAVALISTVPDDPLCYMAGGAIGAVFGLMGVILLIEGFLKGGLEE